MLLHLQACVGLLAANVVLLPPYHRLLKTSLVCREDIVLGLEFAYVRNPSKFGRQRGGDAFLQGTFRGHVEGQLRSTHHLLRLLSSFCFAAVDKASPKTRITASSQRTSKNHPLTSVLSYFISVVFKCLCFLTELIKIHFWYQKESWGRETF